jgi:molybdopterin-guanine dinucleotide biosynthesis protein A
VADVVGAVLAGGRATRLGRPKATAPLGGRALLEHPLEALRRAGLETAIVAKPRSELPALEGVPVWTEPATPAHPLLGIVTALEQAQGRGVLACACDLPFVTAELVRFLADLDAPVAVPRAGGRLHPLLALYGAALLAPLRDALDRSASMHETVDALGARIVTEEELRQFGDPARLLFNVNTPEDLGRAERYLAAGP